MPKSRRITTGGLDAKTWAKINPEILRPRPSWVDWSFDLPKEVDFYFAMTRHESYADFKYAMAFMEHVDIVLLECAEADYDAIEELETLTLPDGEVNEWYRVNRKAIQRCISGYQLAFMDGLLRYKPNLAVFDPPVGHEAYDMQVSEAWSSLAMDDDINELAYGIVDDQMIKRDIWALHNLKQLIDDAMIYVPGSRRRVLIPRGMRHFGLMRAIEWQCEYAPGNVADTRVVASVINLAGKPCKNGEDYITEDDVEGILRISTRT